MCAPGAFARVRECAAPWAPGPCVRACVLLQLNQRVAAALQCVPPVVSESTLQVSPPHLESGSAGSPGTRRPARPEGVLPFRVGFYSLPRPTTRCAAGTWRGRRLYGVVVLRGCAPPSLQRARLWQGQAMGRRVGWRGRGKGVCRAR
jgi:hypothetical protein